MRAAAESHDADSEASEETAEGDDSPLQTCIADLAAMEGLEHEPGMHDELGLLGSSSDDESTSHATADDDAAAPWSAALDTLDTHSLLTELMGPPSPSATSLLDELGGLDSVDVEAELIGCEQL